MVDFNKVKEFSKPWGKEVHWAVEDKYVGKILEIKEGQRLSLQYHEVKKETMYVLEGEILLTLGDEELTFSKGHSVTINPGVKHRVKAIRDSIILEASTTELDDLVRIEDDYER